MEFLAYHGHFDAEKVVGNKFLVTLQLETDCECAAKTDNLEEALDYQIAYNIVKECMQESSNLLEHVAGRILDKLYEQFKQQLECARIKISKMNPPLGGQINRVSVVLERYIMSICP